MELPLGLNLREPIGLSCLSASLNLRDLVTDTKARRMGWAQRAEPHYILTLAGLARFRSLGFHYHLLPVRPSHCIPSHSQFFSFPLSNSCPPSHLNSRNILLNLAQWGPLKASGFGPLGQLPVLSLDGRDYCQSVPISKYAATLAGLYPTDPLGALNADEVVAIIDELWNKIATTDAKVPETREKYGSETTVKYFRALNDRVAGGNFFNGASTPQWADLWFFAYVQFFTSGFLDHLPKNFVEVGSPELWALYNRILESDLFKQFGSPSL